MDEGGGSGEVRIRVKGGGERRSMYEIMFCLQYAPRSVRWLEEINIGGWSSELKY